MNFSINLVIAIPSNFSKSIIETSKVYIFEPTKSLTIPAYNFSVNGKKQTTKPIKITVKGTYGNRVLEITAEPHIEISWL